MQVDLARPPPPLLKPGDRLPRPCPCRPRGRRGVFRVLRLAGFCALPASRPPDPRQRSPAPGKALVAAIEACRTINRVRSASKWRLAGARAMAPTQGLGIDKARPRLAPDRRHQDGEHDRNAAQKKQKHVARSNSAADAPPAALALRTQLCPGEMERKSARATSPNLAHDRARP
jgi:hypothetical protein